MMLLFLQLQPLYLIQANNLSYPQPLQIHKVKSCLEMETPVPIVFFLLQNRFSNSIDILLGTP